MTQEPALPGEVWATIPGYPNYEASTMGRVRNARNGHVLKPCSTGRNGYLKVHLGVARQMTVHRAVALAHLPPPEGGDLLTRWDVDHEDFNRTNNVVTNLRWMRAAPNRSRWLKHNQEQEAIEEAEHVELTGEEEEAVLAAMEAAGW